MVLYRLKAVLQLKKPLFKQTANQLLNLADENLSNLFNIILKNQRNHLIRLFKA
jgi:hypothetical protein